LLEARHAGVIGDADMVRPDVGDQHGFPQKRPTGRRYHNKKGTPRYGLMPAMLKGKT